LPASHTSSLDWIVDYVTTQDRAIRSVPAAEFATAIEVVKTTMAGEAHGDPTGDWTRGCIAAAWRCRRRSRIARSARPRDRHQTEAGDG